MTPHIRHLIEVHLAVLLFGAAGLFGKLIHISSGGIVLGRAASAAIFLIFSSWIIHLYQYKKMNSKPSLWETFKPKSSKDLLSFGLLGILLAFHWSAFFESIQRSNVTIGVLTFSTFPIFTILIAPWFTKEKLVVSDLILALVAFGGILLVMPSFSLDNQYTQGALWGIAAGASFAILTLSSQQMIQGYSSNCVSFYQNGIAALVLAPFYSQAIRAGSQQDWWYIILLGVVFTGIAHTLFINSMNSLKAQTVSLIANLEPAYGILLAWLILRETPNVQVLLGGSIILVVAFFAMSKK